MRHSYWITDDIGRTYCADCTGRLPYVKELDLDDDCGGVYEVQIDKTDYCPHCGAKMDIEEEYEAN